VNVTAVGKGDVENEIVFTANDIDKIEPSKDYIVPDIIQYLLFIYGLGGYG
jgi:hypothetical protein